MREERLRDWWMMICTRFWTMVPSQSHYYCVGNCVIVNYHIFVDTYQPNSPTELTPRGP